MTPKHDEPWKPVDRYFEERLIPKDPVLADVLEASERAGLPEHAVSANQGKLLAMLAQVQRARRILEIGTLGGYSTIWLARALPSDGRLVTLEASARHAEVARANVERAGLSKIVELREGTASDSLVELVEERVEPFDLVFIDADKPSNPVYLQRSLELTRPGSLIVADNVVRDGAVIDSESVDPRVQGVRAFVELLAGESRLEATWMQTVGEKGYDGFVIARVIPRDAQELDPA